MTAYEEGRQAYQKFIDNGMKEEDSENPYSDRSKPGLEWQRGYDDARTDYLR